MSPKNQIRAMLTGGDRRSIGRVDELVDLGRRDSHTISLLVEYLWDEDPVVCMRAADALEKISRENATLVQSHKGVLLALLAQTTQQEVKWHVAVIVPRLQLTASECSESAKTLQTYLEDRSSIVKTSAMQGLADLTEQYASLRPVVIDLIRLLARTGTPAMRARGRKLLDKLESLL